MKFLTIEGERTILYTWQKSNGTYYRKPVLSGRAERINSAEFLAAYSAARARRKQYFEVAENDG